MNYETLDVRLSRSFLSAGFEVLVGRDACRPDKRRASGRFKWASGHGDGQAGKGRRKERKVLYAETPHVSPGRRAALTEFRLRRPSGNRRGRDHPRLAASLRI